MKTIKRASAIVLLLAMLLTICTTAFAATTYYTTGSVNMRVGPDRDYRSIKTIPKGTKLTSKGSDVDWRGVKWIYCSYNGKSGWVSTRYLKKGSAPTPKNARVIANKGQTYIRTRWDRDSRSLGILPKGASAKYLGVKKADADGRDYWWYKISYKGTTGYVSSRYTKLSY